MPWPEDTSFLGGVLPALQANPLARFQLDGDLVFRWSSAGRLHFARPGFHIYWVDSNWDVEIDASSFEGSWTVLPDASNEEDLP